MYAIQPWDMYMYLIDVVHLDILLLKAYYTIVKVFTIIY